MPTTTKLAELLREIWTEDKHLDQPGAVRVRKDGEIRAVITQNLPHGLSGAELELAKAHAVSRGKAIATALDGYRLAMLLLGLERRRLDRSSGGRQGSPVSPEEWALLVENALAILTVTGDR